MFRATGKLAIDIINPKLYGDKVARVHAVQHLFADSMVYAPDRLYADMVIKQCSLFPKGSKDDLVDTVSMAMRYLRDAGFALRHEEYHIEDEEELRYNTRRNVPLYPV